MSLKLICNSTHREQRVALLENGQVLELFIEKREKGSVVGNIYNGLVTKILPGIQVAFVDIGIFKPGFLYVSSINPKKNGSPDENILSTLEDSGEIKLSDNQEKRGFPIEELVTDGESLLTQVSKNPIGSKGPKLSTFITLPGRYVVMLEGADNIAISRRIYDDAERERLKELITELKGDRSVGYIVRTAAAGKGVSEIKNDIEYLNNLWEQVKNSAKKSRAPSLVYQELGLIERSIRDLSDEYSSEVIIDDHKEFLQAKKFCTRYLPHLADRISFYNEPEPIFDFYNIEIEIERALERKVWLKSGGYIVIDQTEALTTIDVNTGRFTGAFDQEETIFKTNMEAVQEIVYQVKLRNIGGLLIIDFIDMGNEDNRAKVFNFLGQKLKNDRQRTNILKISELGLVEMSRKRVRNSLSRSLMTSCPHCKGQGMVKSPNTIINEIFREITRVAKAGRSDIMQKVACKVAPTIANILLEEESLSLEGNKRFNVDISVIAEDSFRDEQYEVAIMG
ncbi:MAG: Rne/Rng family ribonuclease [Nitrospinota bacterium]